MIWLYRVQQRISITRREGLALLTVAGLFVLGSGVQAVQQRMTPPLDAAPLVPAAAPALPVAHSTDPTNDDASSPGAPAVPTGPISLNTATAADLQTLPRIGPALAARILAYRARTGGFRTTEDLMDVRGIGAKTLERLRPLVTTGGPHASRGDAEGPSDGASPPDDSSPEASSEASPSPAESDERD